MFHAKVRYRETVQAKVRVEKQSKRKLEKRNSPSESKSETVQAKIRAETQSKR